MQECLSARERVFTAALFNRDNYDDKKHIQTLQYMHKSLMHCMSATAGKHAVSS